MVSQKDTWSCSRRTWFVILDKQVHMEQPKPKIENITLAQGVWPRVLSSADTKKPPQNSRLIDIALSRPCHCGKTKTEQLSSSFVFGYPSCGRILETGCKSGQSRQRLWKVLRWTQWCCSSGIQLQTRAAFNVSQNQKRAGSVKCGAWWQARLTNSLSWPVRLFLDCLLLCCLGKEW